MNNFAILRYKKKTVLYNRTNETLVNLEYEVGIIGHVPTIHSK